MEKEFSIFVKPSDRLKKNSPMIPIGHPIFNHRVSQGKEEIKERKRNAHDAL
jgi:hypothetical protein